MGYETSINIFRANGVICIHKIAIDTSMYDGTSKWHTKKECEEELNKITPSAECEKIWNTFDYQAIKNTCRKITIDESINDHLLIKSFEEFEKALKDMGIYQLYFEEKESLDKKRELLKNKDLIEVKFRKYQSWETGLCFLILGERVEKDIFSKLKKAGLYYHEVDEENEERFTGWCVIDNEMNRLKLAANGIRAI